MFSFFVLFFQGKSEVITAVKLLSCFDDLVAVGTASGRVTLFQLVSQLPGRNKQVSSLNWACNCCSVSVLCKWIVSVSVQILLALWHLGRCALVLNVWSFMIIVLSFYYAHIFYMYGFVCLFLWCIAFRLTKLDIILTENNEKWCVQRGRLWPDIVSVAVVRLFFFKAVRFIKRQSWKKDY